MRRLHVGADLLPVPMPPPYPARSRRSPACTLLLATQTPRYRLCGKPSCYNKSRASKPTHSLGVLDGAGHPEHPCPPAPPAGQGPMLPPPASRGTSEEGQALNWGQIQS